MTPAIWIHLVTAAVALPLAVVMLARRKGDGLHKRLGRAWAAIMIVVALSSYWVVETNDGEWSWIHILSTTTLISIAFALVAIRRGRVSAHKQAMVLTCGGLFIAFGFTFLPGRLLAEILF